MAGDAAQTTIPETRALATRLLADVSTLAQEMLDYLVARIPEAGTDAEIKGLTLGSCSSNLETPLSMIRHGIPVSATEAPVTALEHARAMAARGHSVDVMLRFYRLGLAYFTDILHEGIDEWISDPQIALQVVGELERFAIAYNDRISSQVAAEYVAELDRRQRRARAVRLDTVRTLLAGAAVDLASAERALSHRLAGAQLAFVCWGDHDVDVGPLASAVAAELGSRRPLLVADGARALWGWVTGVAAADPDTRAVRAAVEACGVAGHVALGERHDGRAGFRASHREGLRVRRVVELSGRRAPSVTRFAEIAVVDALSQDLDAARALVARELGALAVDGVREREERLALLAVLDARGSLAGAAAALALHRNTVLQRVRRAEKRRGRPVNEALLELHAALRLAQVLGPAVLSPEQP
jgi:hypothetical protein